LTFARLPLAEQILFGRYLAGALALEVALLFLAPHRIVGGWARCARRIPWPRTVARERRYRLATAAASVVRPGRACLPAALLLWREELAAGEAARLVIGVRTDPAFLAHAW